MKSITAFILLLIAVLLPFQAHAMLTFYGREAVHNSAWVPGLDLVVNHSNRIGGVLGPFGPVGRFNYSGNAQALNEVLEIYARVTQPAHILYLTPSDAPAATRDLSDFELSITSEGLSWMHLNVQRASELQGLKIPKGVAVETLPAQTVLLDPQAAKRVADLQKSIDAFVKDHSDRKPSP